MEIKFEQHKYSETKKDENGEDIVQKETKTMYTFEITANYFIDNKLEVAKKIEEDLINVVKALHKTIEKNEKALESWDRTEK